MDPKQFADQRMTDQPQSERFKAEMPHIPGVAAGGASRQAMAANPTLRLVAGLAIVLFVCLFGARWLLRPKHAEAPPAAPPPQIEVPAPAVDPTASMPRATAASSGNRHRHRDGEALDLQEFFLCEPFDGRERSSASDPPILWVGFASWTATGLWRRMFLLELASSNTSPISTD